MPYRLPTQIRQMSDDIEACKEQASLTAAYKKAFQIVCNIVDKEVLKKEKVMKLSDLRFTYCIPGHYNKRKSQL